MKNYILCLTFIFILLSGIQTVKAQRKIQLFNQKDLKGWYAFEPETGKHNDASELFKVENNMIRLYGKKLGYLMSEQSFKNFKLKVEFRWNLDTTFGNPKGIKNSGVMYLVPSETPDILWPKGIQFQIKDGAIGDFVLLKEVTLDVNGQKTEAGKSVVSKRFLDSTLPDGEWQTLEVTVKNGSVKQELNGKLVNEGKNATVNEGRVLLQYEGFPIDFRKIEIKKTK